MRVIFHESFFMFKIELEKARLRQNSKHDLDTKSNFLFLYCSFFITMKPSIITRKNGGSVFSRRKKTCLSMAVLLKDFFHQVTFYKLFWPTFTCQYQSRTKLSQIQWQENASAICFGGSLPMAAYHYPTLS